MMAHIDYLRVTWLIQDQNMLSQTIKPIMSLQNTKSLKLIIIITYVWYEGDESCRVLIENHPKSTQWYFERMNGGA